MNELACNETEILDACLSWTKNACQQDGIDGNNAENLRFKLGECFYLIRFAEMKVEEFAAHTVSYRGLLTGDEIADIVYIISVPDFSSSKFIEKPRTPIDPRKWDGSKKTVPCQRFENDCFDNQWLDSS